jgi:hypothetical protein
MLKSEIEAAAMEIAIRHYSNPSETSARAVQTGIVWALERVPQLATFDAEVRDDDVVYLLMDDLRKICAVEDDNGSK